MSVELCDVCMGAEMRAALMVAWRPRRRRRKRRAMVTMMKTMKTTPPITPPIIPPMDDECDDECSGWEVDEEFVSVVDDDDVVVVVAANSGGKGNISPYPLVGLHSTYVKVAPGSLSVEYAYVKQYGFESELCGGRIVSLMVSSILL